MSQSGLSLNDLHAELRCLILRLRNNYCELSQAERERVEGILWMAKDCIGNELISRERFEQLYETNLKSKSATARYKQKKRAG